MTRVSTNPTSFSAGFASDALQPIVTAKQTADLTGILIRTVAVYRHMVSRAVVPLNGNAITF
jgi:hypothetical protein